MYVLSLILSIVLSFESSVQQSDVKSVLKELDEAIEKQEQYCKPKELRIKNLVEELQISSGRPNEFNICNQLFEEYKYYQYDSAYVYARKLESFANKSGKRTDAAIAQAALLFCYKSVGFFNEALEIIRSFQPEEVPDEILVNFYVLCASTYQNLSSYVYGTQYLTEKYNKKVLEYYKRALEYTSDYTFYHHWISLEIALIQEYSDDLAIDGRKNLIGLFNLDEHQLAVQYSILANACDSKQMNQEATYYRAVSAIYDIKSCVHETTSAKVLAEYMYAQKDINHAYSYIQLALRDAQFYNSRLRMVEINSIFPAIEQSRYSDVNSQRLLFMVGGSVVLFFLVLTLILLLILSSKSREIRKANTLLARVNSLLKETSVIKDRYIMQSLQGNTSFVNNVEKESLAAIRKITTRQYEDAKAILYNLGVKDERERIYTAFDTAFLALFPNFIEAFNSLMNEDTRITLDKSGALPMEVRIFALMRLGIDDPAQVAEYLHLSVNTIYVYKNKIKSKASVSKDQFDTLVMAISK
ncbi:MAG: DUF6377 domain-containing protein [Bacteroidales bacterium]|jgi:hypothetical protein|nr:DUF6377 domain-containing protein [Bacteroidales bacterium]